MKTTSFYCREELAGAQFAEFDDWRLPADFGDARREYEAARASVGMFDAPVGLIEVAGPEAPSFLHNLCSNDIVSMPLGAGCEAFFCNARARALFHTHIYRVKPNGRDAFWIDVAPGYDAGLMQHLDRHLIAEQVELANRSSEFSTLHLAGPNAASILSTSLGETMPRLDSHQHMERTFGQDAVAHIRRHDPLGLPGFDIICLNSRAGDVWDALVNSGALPAGRTAREILRVEAGTPLFGRDIDENRFVQEVGRIHAVSFEKGCYLGQEPIVMARDRAGFLNRYFRGLQLQKPAATGAQLFAPENVGIITSAVESPRLGPIALGYIKRGHEAAGSIVHVESATGPEAVVCDIPFSS